MLTDSTFLGGRVGFEVLVAKGYPKELVEGYNLVYVFLFVRLLGLTVI